MLRKQIVDHENRVQAERKALREEQEQFEKEKENSMQAIKDQSAKLAARENELRHLDITTPTERYEGSDPATLNEIAELRREVKALMGRPNAYFGTAEGAGSVSFRPPSHVQEPSGYFVDPREESASPKISFREALETVPYFDGYNLTVSQFARACRRAKEIIPPSSERNLTRLLCNKLRGRALVAVEDEACFTVTQLIDLLTTAFGARKTIDQYKGELSTIYLKSGEHILDFISRVKDLRSSIIDAERRERGDTNIDYEGINGLTARSFCDGLPLEYRIQLQPDLHNRPFEAFAAAKAIARRQELDRDRYGRSSTLANRPQEHSAKPIGRPLAQSTPIRSNDYRRIDNLRPPAPSNWRSGDNRPVPNDARHSRYPQTNNNAERAASEPRNTMQRLVTWRRDNERPQKFCRYCKNPKSGNEVTPSGLRGAPRADSPSRTRPIQTITAETEASGSQS
jgi:hypothetical protein